MWGWSCRLLLMSFIAIGLTLNLLADDRLVLLPMLLKPTFASSSLIGDGLNILVLFWL